MIPDNEHQPGSVIGVYQPMWFTDQDAITIQNKEKFLKMPITCPSIYISDFFSVPLLTATQN